jgi:large conductance mechanosensitive channel
MFKKMDKKASNISEGRETMKKFFQEFREFAIQGNMMAMAVGIIIGGAFTAIVTSLVDHIINPVLGIFIGGIDFTNLFYALDGNKYATVEAAQEAGVGVIQYGAFIMAIINFIIIAIVVFCMLKVVNGMAEKMKKQKEEEAPTVKTCPFCQSEIAIAATRCPHCTSLLDDVDMKIE